METALAILMALGIFVAIPCIIGISIAGMFVLKDIRIKRTKYARAMEGTKAAVKEKTNEHAPVA